MKTISIFIFVFLFVQQASVGQNLDNRKLITIGHTDSVDSKILGENRKINIYLPQSYSPDSPAIYPVIYLLDGGVEEDFIHIAGLARYYTTPWIHQFPESIVVGIENTDRRRDFTFATPNLDFLAKIGFEKSMFPVHGGSQQFISFIEQELQPYIQFRYKVNASKTIIGESLGGLLTTEILLKKPHLFDTYIIVSPSLWWGNEALLNNPNQLQEKTFTKQIKVYVGAAKKEEDLVMYNDAVRLAANIQKMNRKNIQLKFDYLKNESHATLMHQAVCNAFKLLYPKKK